MPVRVLTERWARRGHPDLLECLDRLGPLVLQVHKVLRDRLV